MSFKCFKLRRKVCIHYKSTEASKYKFLTKGKKQFQQKIKNNDSKVSLKKKKGQADQLTRPSSIQNVLKA